MGQGEASEIVDGAGERRVVLTCEHASVDLPEPWAWSEDDRWLVGTHWSFDLGIAEVTRELAAILGCGAVLSRASRLLCDPNRVEGDPDLFRTKAEGRAVALNTGLTPDEKERRLAAYHRPYHAAIEGILRRSALEDGAPRGIVLSMHSFTPLYEGNPREVEIGVLFDEEDDLGIDLATAMTDRGLNVWLNEPYSGKDGLIYSAKRHAAASGRAALELEIRQDLAADPAWRAENLPLIAEAIREILEERPDFANEEPEGAPEP